MEVRTGNMLLQVSSVLRVLHRHLQQHGAVHTPLEARLRAFIVTPPVGTAACFMQAGLKESS